MRRTTESLSSEGRLPKEDAFIPEGYVLPEPRRARLVSYLFSLLLKLVEVVVLFDGALEHAVRLQGERLNKTRSQLHRQRGVGRWTSGAPCAVSRNRFVSHSIKPVCRGSHDTYTTLCRAGNTTTTSTSRLFPLILICCKRLYYTK